MVGVVASLPLGCASVLGFVSTPPGAHRPPLRAVTSSSMTQLTHCFSELLMWEGTLPQRAENCEQRNAHVAKHKNSKYYCRRISEVVSACFGGGLHDSPSSSTKHGAAIVSLQSLPLALMFPMQQLSCGPGTRR